MIQHDAIGHTEKSQTRGEVAGDEAGEAGVEVTGRCQDIRTEVQGDDVCGGTESSTFQDGGTYGVLELRSLPILAYQ